jgi:hypothetical protein
MKGGEKQMNEFTASQLRLVNALIAARITEASNERLNASSRPSRIRQSIGHSIIRIGERLVAEPPLEPARSR